jgi:hypothetical protein
MRGAIPPYPQYAFMAWFLVKHRDNFNFTFYHPYRLLNWEMWTALGLKKF